MNMRERIIILHKSTLELLYFLSNNNIIPNENFRNLFHNYWGFML